MSSPAVRIAPDTVRIERILPGPIERVWDYLTDAELRGRWLASGPMELKTGGKSELRFRHDELSDAPGEPPARYAEMARKGHVNHGHVLLAEPPRLLVITWDDAQDPPSEVRFELSEHGDDVRLTLTHSRLAGDDATSVSRGWHTHLDILGDRLAGRAPQNFWEAHRANAALYGERDA
jgi:uncharacterized protein YndB with AHSA1/START domain